MRPTRLVGCINRLSDRTEHSPNIVDHQHFVSRLNLEPAPEHIFSAPAGSLGKHCPGMRELFQCLQPEDERKSSDRWSE